MGLQEEYATIRDGIKNGSLKMPPREKPRELWTSRRFAANKDGVYSSMGEHYDARESSSISYSFGKCTLKDSMKVSIPNDMKNGMTSDSPGPQVEPREHCSPGLVCKCCLNVNDSITSLFRCTASRGGLVPEAHNILRPMCGVGQQHISEQSSASPLICVR